MPRGMLPKGLQCDYNAGAVPEVAEDGPKISFGLQWVLHQALECDYFVTRAIEIQFP